MKLTPEDITNKILEQFDEVTRKISESKSLFEAGEVKASYETLWSVESLTNRLSQTLSWYRCRTTNGRSFNDATQQEVEHLATLNIIFADLQAQTRAKVAEIKKEIDGKQSTGDSFLSDYEIDTSVVFILGKDDPFHLEDDDNFICVLPHPIFDVQDEDDSDDDNYNYNDMVHCPDHPLQGQHHCLFFHELLAHTHPHVSLDDVLRVGEVWIDVKAWHQCYRELPRLNSSKEKDLSCT